MPVHEISVQRLCKRYGTKAVLQDLTSHFPAGQCSAIMAPSGAGKTTLLRLLMGLEAPDSGEIIGLDGQALGAVFQEDRLCENLTAQANVQLIGADPADAQSMLASLGLGAAADQPVRELSGGMRRRVAIARALCSAAQVLFLDEPFKGLDDNTKAQVMDTTRRACVGRTTLLVTHDAAETAALGAAQLLKLPVLDSAGGGSITEAGNC